MSMYDIKMRVQTFFPNDS